MIVALQVGHRFEDALGPTKYAVAFQLWNARQR